MFWSFHPLTDKANNEHLGTDRLPANLLFFTYIQFISVFTASPLNLSQNFSTPAPPPTPSKKLIVLSLPEIIFQGHRKIALPISMEFCSRSSDVISKGKHSWKRHEMSAVFSSYS